MPPNTVFLPNRAARRKHGLRKQKAPVKIDVPLAQALRRGVKEGDRFVIPGKRLGADGKLEPCKIGEETLFLAHILNPTEQAHANIDKPSDQPS